MMRVYGKELNAFIGAAAAGFLIFRKILWKKMQLYFEDPQYCAMEKKIYYALHIIWQQNGNLS